MRILGIDPGLATVGWGVIDVEKGRPRVVSYGVILTPKEKRLPERLQIIEEDVRAIIDKYKPDEIALEELFFNSNVTTAINVAQARGVILVTAVKGSNGKLYEYTPLQIKQALTGYGRAEKRQIQEMTKTFLGLSKIPKPDDAADALAVALTHSQTSGGLNAGFQIR
jgi:crossover junction endodeoxyribonuclease RuvC